MQYNTCITTHSLTHTHSNLRAFLSRQFEFFRSRRKLKRIQEKYQHVPHTNRNTRYQEIPGSITTSFFGSLPQDENSMDTLYVHYLLFSHFSVHCVNLAGWKHHLANSVGFLMYCNLLGNPAMSSLAQTHFCCRSWEQSASSWSMLS